MGLFLCVALALLLIGALPFWSHMRGRDWGYGPSVIFGVMLVGIGALLYYDIISWR